MISSFNLSTTACCSDCHLNSTFLWVSLWIGSATVERSGMTLDTNWARPRSDHASLVFCSGSALWIKTIFLTRFYPICFTWWPKNVNLGNLSSHLSPFNVKPTSFNWLSTTKSLSSCYSTSLPWITRSSAILTTPSQPHNTSRMICWYFLGAEVTQTWDRYIC